MALDLRGRLQGPLVHGFPFMQGQVHALAACNRQLNKLVLLDAVQGSLEMVF